MNKTEQFNLRITENQRNGIERRAAAKGWTMGEVVSQAIDLYLGLPDGFLKGVEEDAERLQLSPVTVMDHLLLVYSAMESAIISEGLDSKIYQYAFRYDKEGLLSAHDAGVLTFKEVKEKIQDIKRRANIAKRTKKEVGLDNYDKGLVAHAL